MAGKTRTALEDYLVYGVDEKHRRVFFGESLITGDSGDVGGFSQCSIQYAIRAMQRMADDYPKVPIEIHMDSYGGDPYAMLGLYDFIQSSDCQIKFFGRGAIMSAATWIMAGCDERYLYPNTTVMIHDGWNEPGLNTVTEQEIYQDEEHRLRDKLHEIYESNSRMPKEFWAEVCKRDLYLTAEEAVLLGLADKIIQPKKRGNLRKTRDSHLSDKVEPKKLAKVTDKLMKRIKTNTKIEIILKDHKSEVPDDALTIEAMPLTETKNDKNT